MEGSRAEPLRYPVVGNGKLGGPQALSDLLIVAGALMLAASLPLVALRVLSFKPGLFPFLVLGTIVGIWLIRNPRWIVPCYIGLVWTSIEAAYFGGLPSPIESAGLVLLAVATWQALLRLDYTREVLIICGLIAIPLLAGGIASPQGMEVPVAALKNVTFLFLIALIVRTIKDVDRATVTLSWIGVFLGAGALFSIFGHPTRLFPLKAPEFQFQVIAPRAAGPIGDPNFFALVMAALTPFALYLIACGRRRQWLGALATILIIGGVLATGSRGGMLAVGFAIVTCGIVMPVRRLRVVATVVVVLTLVALPLFAIQRQDAEGRSTEGRLTENKIALAMFADHPVTGVGPSQYPPLYRDYSRNIGNDTRPIREPHSLPLEVAAEQGIAGILGWLVAFAAVFRFALRRGVWDLLLGRALVLAVATYMVASLFLHGSEIRLLWLLLGLVMALGHAVSREAPEARSA
jgi:O-antigen ligase